MFRQVTLIESRTALLEDKLRAGLQFLLRDQNICNMRSQRSKATPSGVVEGLRHHQFSHFVCHGNLEQGKPLDASFQFHGSERLTLLDVVCSRLPTAEFAFLPACTTGSVHSVRTGPTSCCVCCQPISSYNDPSHGVGRLSPTHSGCNFRSPKSQSWYTDFSSHQKLYLNMGKFGEGEARSFSFSSIVWYHARLARCRRLLGA
jgi:hypothetical protein